METDQIKTYTAFLEEHNFRLNEQQTCLGFQTWTTQFASKRINVAFLEQAVKGSLDLDPYKGLVLSAFEEARKPDGKTGTFGSDFNVQLDIHAN